MSGLSVVLHFKLQKSVRQSAQLQDFIFPAKLARIAQDAMMGKILQLLEIRS